MKLYLTDDVGKNISGYETIPVKNGDIDLSHVVNNSCEEILFTTGIEKVEVSNFQKVLNEILSKMRIGCKLVISGIDLEVLSRYVINGSVNTSQYAELIKDKNFISSLSDIRAILNSVGLKINSANIKDIHYEISATREKVSN